MNRRMSRQREDQQRVSERAAEWFNALEDAGAEERVEFMEWISRSPRHLEEFLLTSAVAREIKNVDLQSLKSKSTQVVRLPIARADLPQSHPPESRSGSKAWRWRAALAASLLVAAIVTIAWLPGRWQSYATSAGEQRALQLADGTVVHLNMRSHIEVRFSRGERSVRLREGEALFTVARDAERPFRVHSGASLIQAIGTEFNVLRRPLGTTVSVLEGIVQVSADSTQHSQLLRPARLGAGEEARIAVDGQIEKRHTVGVGAVAQWRQHRLEFRTDALVDIAAEFNRYNAAPQIVVMGDAIKTRHYSGVFDASDPQSLIQFLRQDPDLVLETTTEGIVIRGR